MQKLRARHEVPAEYKWDLESVYASVEAWEQDFARLKARIPELATCRGQLGASAADLLRCLQLHDDLSRSLEQVYVYARMRRDEDNASSFSQALSARATSLVTEFSSASSFFAPEILAIPEERLQAFLDAKSDLQLYGHWLDQLRRQREHVRSAEVEEVLAQAGEVARAPRDVFGMLTNADMKFPAIKDDQGEEVELTNGRYIQFVESTDRRVRRDAFTTLHATYNIYRNTLASSLASTVRRDVFYARSRRYPSALDAALQPENIPTAVYHNLLATVEKNLPSLHRYMALRKRTLGLDELHMYDLYVPMVPEVKQEIPFEGAVSMVVDGLAPLGEEYVAALQEGIHRRWVDVYENEGKTSGAYSGGAYTTYPFILLNYQNNLSSVFTLAHELGHSMHSYYTRRTQPYLYGHYTIFVAEVASTLNEALLTEHLLRTSQDEQLRLYLLNQYLEKFRTTLYRQTMFAEFELLTHQRIEAGEALTPDLLSTVYRDLNAKYYGPQVVLDEGIAIEWGRIPHFYSAFYVYQYATGISAAAALSQQILKEGPPAVSRYLDFLKSGESAYSIDLLKRAGVDMTSPTPVQQALDVFAGLIDRMEALAGDGDAKQQKTAS
jgi:oligoendopeptidase F